MSGDGGGAYVLFPYSTEEKFGIKGRVPVLATIDGRAVSRLARKIWQPAAQPPILKAIREKIGKKVGDTIEITVEHDAKTREVEIPKDLAKALKQTSWRQPFREMAYSHQREYVLWIEGAEKAETKEK
jgi:bifunctional DNA-binding transcriptional regulator/antitoxin component of YhaV-PrlF toxin-antitoxin module